MATDAIFAEVEIQKFSDVGGMPPDPLAYSVSQLCPTNRESLGMPLVSNIFSPITMDPYS